MAGKSNKGRNRKRLHSATNNAQSGLASDTSKKDSTSITDASKSEANGVVPTEKSEVGKSEAKENEAFKSTNPAKQGELNLFPIPVKTFGGDKLELQLNPGDSVMDVRQFLLDAPETCFFTSYDLLLHSKDGSVHPLEDYSEISQVADITTGDCSLEMVAAPYDDRSIRAQVHRTRELLSLSTLPASLSTSLALQPDAAQNTSHSADSVKPEVWELDGLGFMEDVAGSLPKLMFPTCKEIKCVETLVFSSFNPPPSFRRLVGDLIYLDIVTLEGAKFCITGTTIRFYVNSSSGNTLDPRPNKAADEANTLVGLLQKISPKFRKAFRENLERKASAHPFENVQSMLPPHKWLGLYPVPDHKRDAARAESAVSLTFGSEIIGMQRDWNEELQSCREFPCTTPQERILRDRALYKVTSDFVDAATNGAIGVISRCIPPINPTDPECFHMYVHNNIFFSFAVDVDLEQLSKMHVQVSNLKLADTASAGNLTESLDKGLDNAGNLPDGIVRIPNEVESNGLNKGLVDVASNAAELQLVDGEQATYASANNDLRGTKAFQEADVPGLYSLAMAIIDYRGHRVVAQSVLPGILQGDKSDSLLYGFVDNGKKLNWNEDFHSKVLEAAKRLHLKEHAVLDGSGTVFRLAAAVECKGIVGSDGRHYLLDLMRVTPRDANYSGPGSQFCILRPELIAAFCQAETAGQPKDTLSTKENVPLTSGSSENHDVDLSEKTEPHTVAAANEQDVPGNEDKQLVGDCQSGTVDSIWSCKQICFNPNVFTEFKLAGNPDEIAADEEVVRKASSFLTDVVLLKFVEDLCTLEVSPMDGQTLTEALHAHGINVRYIGKVADRTKHLPHLWDLCINEIAVRSAKHILKDFLRDTEDHDIAAAISHFFNCFFGKVAPESIGDPVNSRSDGKSTNKSSRGKNRWKTGVSRKNLPSYMDTNSDSLWSDILQFAKVKYQFELPDDATSRVKKVPVIRNLCQKVGITIAARRYHLDNAVPFQVSDILDTRPVVKHSIPVCSEAKDLVETGKTQLAEGMLSEAYTLFSEAFLILQQVTGPIHREVANCCRYLAMVLYHAGDMAGAITQQHKELIINERCLGLDHPDTAHSYGNMALFYHGLNRTELALQHMSRALLLLSLSSGPDHPDVAATFINVAMMFQDVRKMDTALRYLQEALKKNERLLGEEHIQTAVCYHALAIAFNCMGAFKLSHQHEKKTYDILVKQLGEDDSRTRDSENWMKTFKMRELQMNAQKQKGQTLNAATAQKAIDILKAHPDLIQAFQVAVASSGSGALESSTNNSINAAIINETLSRVRGVDERAARAVGEVRKKAAARGLLIRPQGIHVQTVPQINKLLHIINSSMTETVESTDAEKISKDVNTQNSDVDGERVDGEERTQEQNEAPVGLGSGITSLDYKKQKLKKKATT